jgi:hypothetical protein
MRKITTRRRGRIPPKKKKWPLQWKFGQEGRSKYVEVPQEEAAGNRRQANESTDVIQY